MGRIAYQDLAAVYDWLVPEALLTPAGNAAMFEDQIAALRPGARVLDCACGTGTLAVGLAQRGFEVSASDASPAMVERTEALAIAHDVDIDVSRCAWDGLARHDWRSPFGAVWCVGNSLTHAAGTGARRAALGAMHSVMADGGLLFVTSRNWERIRADTPDSEEIVERHGVRARVTHAWHIAADWDAPHHMDIAVALPETTYSERLEFWPFTHAALDDDLRAAGFVPQTSTYGDEVDRYLVTALRAA